MLRLSLLILFVPHFAIAKLPHILYVVADDMGWSDIGFTEGSEKTVTSPFVDGLARDGLILNRHYTAWVCTPTRASIMTGRYPISLGIQHDVFMSKTEECLDETQHLLPEIVRSNGYATHMIGKWHLGYARWSCYPCRRGFDSFMGYTQGKISYIDHIVSIYPDFMECSNKKEQGFSFQTLGELGGIYSGDVYAGKTIEVIEQHNNSKPIFLYLALQMPHKPYYSPIRYIPNNCTSKRCTTQGMINALTDIVASTIDKLKERDMWNDTIMIFHSDNGAPDNEGFNSNYPLRGYKTELWDGGVRTPAFVYSANHKLMPNRGISNSYLHVSDWFMTIIAISGGWENWIKSGHVKPNDLDGIDQSQHILFGVEGERTEIMLHIDPVKRVAGYFKDQYKLLIGDQELSNDCSSTMFYPFDMRCLDFNIIQLFNIVEDPSETTNLAKVHPDITRDMIEKVIAYLNHQKPMQCQLDTDTNGFPSSHVPWYLPWDFTTKIKPGLKII